MTIKKEYFQCRKQRITSRKKLSKFNLGIAHIPGVETDVGLEGTVEDLLTDLGLLETQLFNDVKELLDCDFGFTIAWFFTITGFSDSEHITFLKAFGLVFVITICSGLLFKPRDLVTFVDVFGLLFGITMGSG